MAGTGAVDGVATPSAPHGNMRTLRTTAAQLLVELRQLEQKHHLERDRWLGSWLDQHEQIWSESQAAGTSPALVRAFVQDSSPSQSDMSVTRQSIPVSPVFQSPAEASFKGRMPKDVEEDEDDKEEDQKTASLASLAANQPTAVVPSAQLALPVQGSEGGANTTSDKVVKGSSFRWTSQWNFFSPRQKANEDDVLTRGDSGPSDRTVCSKTGVRKKRKRKQAFNIITQADKKIESKLKRFTKSRIYEVSSAGLIIANAILIGWQTQFNAEVTRDFRSENRDPAELPGEIVWLTCQILFCLAFMVELALRWVADGPLDFFVLSSERGWNIFDATVVFFSVMDILLLDLVRRDKEKGGIWGNISLLRVLRVVRIVRVARIIRVMRFFRELRMMVFSILGSVKSLLWSFMVLGLCFYVFGTQLTVGATEFMQSTLDEDWTTIRSADVLRHFGTLDKSILTLYMSITGGNDWGMYYEALERLPYQYRMCFMLFMFFSIFAVLNIVTGVFVESAMISGNTDREIMVHEEMESKRAYQESMREFFEEADEDGTGNISYAEFTKKLNDERVIAYFNAFKLDVSDASLLFTLLDYDQSGEIQIEEFLDGCYRLQGESRALDMKVMQLEVKWLKESFQHFAVQIVEYLPLKLPKMAPHNEMIQNLESKLHHDEAHPNQVNHPVEEPINSSAQRREAWE